MSISKIKNKIKLLEQELKEINTSVSDPIERNEYKKEIERKIKKLNRTKNSLQQLHKEQQEIESLKYEFELKDNKLAETMQFKADGHQKSESEVETEKSISTVPLPLSSEINISNNQDKSPVPWIKIQFFAILGLILAATINIAIITNVNTARKEEKIRFKKLARQESIEAQEEIQQARQKMAKVEQEKQEAIKEAEKAKQEAIQAKKKADDLIKNNLYIEATSRVSPTESLKKYYLNINNRNYNLAWQYFTPKRQVNSQNFYKYTAWWNSLKKTEIDKIKVLEQNNNQAIVYAELSYFMNTGIIHKERKSKFYLTWDGESNNWLIKDYQQL